MKAEPRSLKSFNQIVLNVNLKKEKENNLKNDFQLIYASQLYGTFFGVAAKFILDDSGKHLEKMQLNLVNYKGLYNLGILEDYMDIAWSNPKDGIATLTLHIQAANGLHGHKKDRTLDVDCKKTPLNELKQMIVTRELYPIYKINKKEYEEILHENLFDSEFYERDGITVLEKVRLDNYGKKQTVKKCQNSLVNFIK